MNRDVSILFVRRYRRRQYTIFVNTTLGASKPVSMATELDRIHWRTIFAACSTHRKREYCASLSANDHYVS